MKYLKKFSTHSDYATFTGGTDFILPNVSYCVNEDEAHFNPIVIQTHEYVDLGLPSGTLWATEPMKNGNDDVLYFAWGEIIGYTADQIGVDRIFDWTNYKYCNGTEKTMTKYCSDTNYGYNGFTDNLTELLSEDDAATVNWGSDWCMPTRQQLNELINSKNCNYELDSENNKYVITSKSNNNVLYLPLYGYGNESSISDYNTNINYLSKTRGSLSHSAYVLRANSGLAVITPRRYYGQCVIPVRASN